MSNADCSDQEWRNAWKEYTGKLPEISLARQYNEKTAMARENLESLERGGIDAVLQTILMGVAGESEKGNYRTEIELPIQVYDKALKVREYLSANDFTLTPMVSIYGKITFFVSWE